MRRKVDRLKVLGTPSDKAKHLRRAENEAIRARLEDIEAGRIKGDLFSEGFDGDPGNLASDPGTEGWYLDQTGLLVVNDAIIRAGTTVEVFTGSDTFTLGSGSSDSLSVAVTPPDWATDMHLSAVGAAEFESTLNNGDAMITVVMGDGGPDDFWLKNSVLEDRFATLASARSVSLSAAPLDVHLFVGTAGMNAAVTAELNVTAVFEKVLA